MNKRNIVVGAGLITLSLAWYAFRPELLFVNKTVDEQFPVGELAAGPTTLAKGQFKSLAHETKGTATIFRLVDGKRTLRLSDFETSNGPDVRVYLVAGEIAKGNDAVKQTGFVDLGSMKGNKGDQNYELPADIDLKKYQRVSIWCARFGVNFGSAPLGEVKS